MICQHKNSKVKYALKVVTKAELDKTFDSRRDLFKEPKIMEKVSRGQSENLLGLVDDFEDNEKHYLVMELCEHGDLLHYLGGRKSSAPVSEKSVKAIMWQLVQGVRTLHKKNIVHSDIKLENVLVAAAGKSTSSKKLKVKLADFGSAVQLDRPQVRDA